MMKNITQRCYYYNIILLRIFHLLILYGLQHRLLLRDLVGKLKQDHKLRVSLDDRRETLGKKIRENQLQKVPYMLILGDRDIENGTVGVRSREDGDLGAMSLEEFIAKVQAQL